MNNHSFDHAYVFFLGEDMQYWHARFTLGRKYTCYTGHPVDVQEGLIIRAKTIRIVSYMRVFYELL
jgi:hypothetical protein